MSTSRDYSLEARLNQLPQNQHIYDEIIDTNSPPSQLSPPDFLVSWSRGSGLSGLTQPRRGPCLSMPHTISTASAHPVSNTFESSAGGYYYPLLLLQQGRLLLLLCTAITPCLNPSRVLPGSRCHSCPVPSGMVWFSTQSQVGLLTMRQATALFSKTL